MSKLRGGMEHTMVSQDSSISILPCIYYGCTVVNATTGGVQAKVFDATSTAQETNPIDVVTIASGTNNNNGTFYPLGIIAHSGLYISAIIATTASDYIIVYYGGV